MLRRLFALALAALPVPALAETEVDVELILAVDVSRSMDFEELKIQRDGYVEALRDPRVISAIRSGLIGRVAVLYFEWAGPGLHHVIADWTLIETAEDADAFADRVAAGRISAAIGTSISGALDWAAAQFDANAYAGLRRVIDVSGDGPNNAGDGVEAARDRVVARGITINGLPLMMKAVDGPFSLRDLDVYYEDCVTGGPLSFVLPLWKLEEFPETVRRKLILEISGVAPPPAPRVMRAQLGLGPADPAPRIDCFIGEKRRARWMRERGWEW